MAIILPDEAAQGARFQRESPALVFSTQLVYDRAVALSSIASSAKITLLLALKAVPHQKFVSIVTPMVHGFDVSNGNELRALPELPTDKVVSLTGPICAQAIEEATSEKKFQMVLNAETEGQLRRAIGCADLGLIAGVRVRSGDHESSGHIAPPFGFDERRLARVLADASGWAGRILAVHVHGGSRENNFEKVMSRARRSLATVKRLGLDVSYANFGGGFMGFSLPQFKECLDGLRSLESERVRILIEPGEFFFADCGWAEATVIDIDRTFEGARAILDLSSEAHLRLSIIHADRRENAGDDGSCLRVDFVGPTCFRGDFLGTRWIRPSHGRPCGVRPGDRIKVVGITSYSAAWNMGFNGVRSATVVVI